MKRNIITLAALLLTLSMSAQFRINMGADSPLRKLQIAEMAISNLYVDSVDETKLVEESGGCSRNWIPIHPMLHRRR